MHRDLRLLTEPLLLNGDYKQDYKPTVIPKLLTLSFPKEIWVIILEYVDLVCSEFSLVEINQYLGPILQSNLETFIYTPADHFSELEAAYLYDQLDLPQQIQKALQFIDTYYQLLDEVQDQFINFRKNSDNSKYVKSNALIGDFIQTLIEKTELLPDEKNGLEQCPDQLIEIFKGNLNNFDADVFVQPKIKLLERRILVNFIRLAGPKFFLFSEAKSQDMTKEYQKALYECVPVRKIFLTFSVFAMIAILILWLSYFLSDLKSRDEPRNQIKNLFIGFSTVLGLLCLICSCCALPGCLDNKKSIAIRKAMAEPGPQSGSMPSSSASSILIAHEIHQQDRIFNRKRIVEKVNFQIIKTKLSRDSSAIGHRPR